MGNITTIFSEEDLEGCGKLVRDIEVLIKEAGQDVPDWLSEGSKSYSSKIENEKSVLSKLLTTSATRFWTLFQFIWLLIFASGSKVLRVFSFIIRSILTKFINNEVKKVKSALWIPFNFFFICSILFTSLFIIFGEYSMKERSDSLYLNLQQFLIDLYETFKTGWYKIVDVLYQLDIIVNSF